MCHMRAWLHSLEGIQKWKRARKDFQSLIHILLSPFIIINTETYFVIKPHFEIYDLGLAFIILSFCPSVNILRTNRYNYYVYALKLL